ncbi:MAG: extracellular solute-binding protein [Elusimicrobiota bacterium]
MREIEIWLLPNNGYETVPNFKNHLASYLREHPAVSAFAKVRTLISLWEDLFRLIKNPHHRPRPDIIQIPARWTSSLAHLGLLQDLRDLDGQLDLRKWFPPVQDNCRLEGSGRIYSLPWWMELRVVFYHRDKLKRAGVEPEALADWRGFKEACAALAAAGFRYPVANPNPRESVALTDVAPSVWSRGGYFFSADGSRSRFQREEAYRAIGDYFDLVDRGWMPLKGQGGSVRKTLFSDDCAIELAGRFPLPPSTRRTRAADGLPKDIGVAPYPDGSGRGSAALQVENLAMLRGVESPREVYALLRELTRDTAAAGYARTIGALPATEGELAKCLDACPEFKEVFRGAMGVMRTYPNMRVMGTLEKVFNRSMERLVSDVLHRDYNSEVLRRELIHAAAEIDYVLSLYGG